MTDTQILEVVEARIEGKVIEWRERCAPQLSWIKLTNKPEWTWDFINYDYRVAPESPKELWLHDCGSGLWRERLEGTGTHFVEKRVAASGNPTVASDTALGKQKPREWTVAVDDDGKIYGSCFTPDGDVQMIRVREIT